MLISDFSDIIKVLNPAKIYNLYHFRGSSGFSIDSRTIAPGEGFIAVKGKSCDGHDFVTQAAARGASLIVAQKDIPNKPKIPFFLVDDSLSAMAALARHIRKIKKPHVWAIAGSVGKTTTKEMLGFLLESRFKVLKNYKTENNIFGVAKTCFSLCDQNAMVMELGTNAPGEMKILAEIVCPDTGIITFIKPVHLEGLKDLKGVFKEKTAMLAANPRMHAILNFDDAYLRTMRGRAKTFWFGKTKKSDLYGRLLRQGPKESQFLIQGEFPLTLGTSFPGFLYNALAALSAAQLAGVPLKRAVERLCGFSAFPSARMQTQERGGLFIFNDAYNANPFSFDAALQAIAQYPVPKIAVVGDMLELGKRSIHYHQALAQRIVKSNFNYCFALGQYTPYLIEKLKQLKFRNAFHCSSHEAIASHINEKAKSGWLVFLKGSRRMELEKVVSLLKHTDKP
ncbi:MAG: UDP-N-acetylmuramoyl-tripeptide--D-alanyl-D-alanine ligase [Candidatus Omnitrophica bacterium]|nr:UDP-N-acetylmuramoyl-tripeptide--D-alanyl-D-alanine ligase [Candidatus Omnitrophota bacterium]